MAMAELSSHDNTVLGALFDPEASLQNRPWIGASTRNLYDSMTVYNIKEAERTALAASNSENPNTQELRRTIQGLSDIISQYPKYPSAWNNRAQARRMLYDYGDSADSAEQLRGVFDDLKRAIELASPKAADEMASPEDINVLASAHTHRGYLLWRASRLEADAGMLQIVPEMGQLSKEQLEELASREFSMGGRYGNQIAHQLAVKTNPYAKLCGSIVREALRREVEDFQGQEQTGMT